MPDDPKAIWISVTNYRGEKSLREVIPSGIHYGDTPWHPEMHWYMNAWDVAKGAVRSFPLASIYRIATARPEGAAIATTPEPATP